MTPEPQHTEGYLSPSLVLLPQHLRHAPLPSQPALPPQLPGQVGLEAADVGLQEGLQVVGTGPGGGRLFLQEAPLGLQHLVLLLQEPHLWSTTEERSWPQERTWPLKPIPPVPGPHSATGSHLVDEEGKLVKGLELLILLHLRLPNLGVDPHIQGLQKALVYGHFMDTKGAPCTPKAPGSTRHSSKAYGSPSDAEGASSKATSHAPCSSPTQAPSKGTPRQDSPCSHTE